MASVSGSRRETRGQTRYLARLEAGGLVTPGGSGRQLSFHLGNEREIEVANVSGQKGQLCYGLKVNPQRRSPACIGQPWC